MIDENTIGKYVSKYGEIEYEQNPDTDDTAWRRIKDLELFAGVIFITLKRSEELAGTEKDLSAIKKVLREKFLEPISSKEYDICYCLPGLNEDVWDPYPIRLFWAVCMAEKHKEELVRNFVRLYLCYHMNKDSNYVRDSIIEIKESLDKNWIDRIKLIYDKYSRGTYGRGKHGGSHALDEECRNMDNFMNNADKPVPAVYHQMLKNYVKTQQKG